MVGVEEVLAGRRLSGRPREILTPASWEMMKRRWAALTGCDTEVAAAAAVEGREKTAGEARRAVAMAWYPRRREKLGALSGENLVKIREREILWKDYFRIRHPWLSIIYVHPTWLSLIGVIKGSI